MVLAHDQGESRQVEAIAQERGMAERGPGGVGQSLQLFGEQSDDVVGDVRLANAMRVPGPGAALPVQFQQTGRVQGAQKMVHEERTTAGLLYHQLSESLDVVRITVQDLCAQRAHLFESERTHLDLLYVRTGLFHGSERSRRGVGRVDFVFAICDHQQEVGRVRIRHHGLEQRERRGVRPLDVVEKEHQWMVRRAEHLHERLKDGDKPDVGFHAIDVGDCWLRTQEPLHIGYHIDDQLTVGTEGLGESLAPGRQRSLVLGEQLAQQSLERFDDGAVGNWILCQIVLAVQKETALSGNRPVQLVDQRRLADTRRANHCHEFSASP